MHRVVAEPVTTRTDFTFMDLTRGAIGPGPAYAVVDGRIVALNWRLEALTSSAVGPGRLLAATPEVADAGVYAIAHPHDGWVVLDAGEGQDGSHVFRARVNDGRLVVEHILTDEFVVDFRPSGDRVLVMPHPSFGGPARVCTWPDLQLVAEYDPDDRVDLHGCFLADDRVLLGGLDDGELRRFIICTEDLVPVALVDVPQESQDAEFEQLHGMAADAFGVDVLSNRTRTATVWRIPGLG